MATNEGLFCFITTKLLWIYSLHKSVQHRSKICFLHAAEQLQCSGILSVIEEQRSSEGD